MQHPVTANRARGIAPLIWTPVLAGAAALLAAGLAGCGGGPTPTAAGAKKPFAGVSLSLLCPDPAFAEAVTPAARSWATRTGAAVTVTAAGMTPADAADVGVIPAAELGAWADRGDLAPVPAALRTPEHPFQWTGLFPAYREHLIEWGGQARALPLAGDGYVIVYRADRLADAKVIAAFRKHAASNPVTPAAWEDFADLAAALAEADGRPSLPPLSGPEAADLFFRVAACYDRPAATTDAAVEKLGRGAGVLSFQFDVRTGGPRVESPAFRAAADWLAGLAARKCLPPAPPPGAPTDPAAELAAGRASLAVLSLAQLARLPRESGQVPARFGLAPLPGTRRYADPATGQLVAAAVPNYVPYHAGGRLGVVRSRCANPDAAFDLLAELGGPTRSAELLSTPGLGAGPFRSTHLEQDRLVIWLGYGFDAEHTKALRTALAQYARPDVRNAVYGLRGPDERELSAAAADELGKVAAGAATAEAALKQLRAAWDRIDAKTPAETRLRWRKFAAGGG